LLQSAADVGALPLDEDLRASAIRLSRHYQPTRYPDALPGGTPRDRYGADDASIAIADAEAIVAAVDAGMNELRLAAEQDGLG
jgi:HEPN domain-containing protein